MSHIGRFRIHVGRMIGAVLALHAVVAVLASGAAGVTGVGGEIASASLPSALPGTLVHVTGTRWSPVGNIVTVQICGQDALNLSELRRIEYLQRSNSIRRCLLRCIDRQASSHAVPVRHLRPQFKRRICQDPVSGPGSARGTHQRAGDNVETGSTGRVSEQATVGVLVVRWAEGRHVGAPCVELGNLTAQRSRHLCLGRPKRWLVCCGGWQDACRLARGGDAHPVLSIDHPGLHIWPLHRHGPGRHGARHHDHQGTDQ